MFPLDRADSTLTCFDLGDVYLMVEPGLPDTGTATYSPAKLRFNVEDVEGSAARLREKDVDIVVQRHSWGITAEFTDPDGNRCALRSEQGFGR